MLSYARLSYIYSELLCPDDYLILFRSGGWLGGWWVVGWVSVWGGEEMKIKANLSQSWGWSLGWASQYSRILVLDSLDWLSKIWFDYTALLNGVDFLGCGDVKSLNPIQLRLRYLKFCWGFAWVLTKNMIKQSGTWVLWVTFLTLGCSGAK